ncbi:hypothetical protein SAMN05444000_101308 [Shimia gijangensis]|uniref:Uncharacterized protein n=1 Tax=Shimia gijangensis TaxID=1470563 RepID=A0A1M6BRR5_9RHOB|nr:hypothetical protein [Shimia gijangensis]SHI51445.1 hypothetical protein SAMN05444000_101308 [Shimia gijangensis]
MNQPVPHKITQCSICPHTNEACKIGYEMARKLCQSIDAGGTMISDEFEISGHVEMVGCTRPCTGAFHATKTACHMFGDVEDGADIEVLLTEIAPVAAITLEQSAVWLA